MLFTVPDYYPDFHCKMGACRHACCEGWPVSISMNDYFRLLGEDCSAELRQRMDVALHLHRHPTPDEYAFINPRWDGNCPLRADDGRCALQNEMGEEALSTVCRLYPRGVRTQGSPECSCAASCEAVTELFLKHPEPLKFIQLDITSELPKHVLPDIFDDSTQEEQALRLNYIHIMQDRALPLPARFIKLYEALTGAECGALEQTAVTPAHLKRALGIAENTLEYAENHSSAVHDYGVSALNYFSDDVERYQNAVNVFNALLPHWETVFEHLIVNHMFFERWPLHDELKDNQLRFAALCGIYGILRFLVLGYVAEHPDIDSFTDVCAAAFRLFEHTRFDLYISSLLTEYEYTSVEALYDFVRL